MTIKRLWLVILLIVAISAISASISGCTTPQATGGNLDVSVTPSPSPTATPLPPWYFTPKAVGWPFNVTDNASFSYTFKNYNVEPTYLRDDSYSYTTLAGNDTTLLHLVYRTMSREKNQVPTQYDIYYDKATGDVINVTRGTGPEGQVTGISELSPDMANSIDVRSKMSDWNSIREKGGTETVTVPAGTFNCTRYNVRFNKTFVSSSIWMADFVPAPVKREMYNETGLAGAVYELTSYSYS